MGRLGDLEASEVACCFRYNSTFVVVKFCLATF